MQKVEGSSPFSRLKEGPAKSGAFSWQLRGVGALQRADLARGVNHGVNHLMAARPEALGFLVRGPRVPPLCARGRRGARRVPLPQQLVAEALSSLPRVLPIDPLSAPRDSMVATRPRLKPLPLS
jgi:hypothetical protein